jgi:inorganic pyrophosphatase
VRNVRVDVTIEILCVPAGDPRMDHLRDIEDVPPYVRMEIERSFERAREDGR